jgi:signal peptidase II
MTLSRETLIGPIVSGIFLMSLDRITKLWALRSCSVPALFTSWCYGELTFNKGLAWSIGSHYTSSGMLALVFVTLLATIVITSNLFSLSQTECLYGTALVFGGALSNLFDRFMYGGVIDFIVLHYQGWQWPTFNIADIAICCGVLLWYLGKDHHA